MRPDVNRRIAGRASSQLGLITVRQTTDAGATKDDRRHMVASGRWRRHSRFVLVDAAAPATSEQELLAVVLDAGRPAYVTGPTAAAFRGVAGFSLRPVHLLVKRGGNHRTPSGAVLHETFWLPPEHVHVVRGVPCVSDIRLPFELAPLVPPKRLRRIVERLRSAHGLQVDDLALAGATLCRRGRPAAPVIRELIDSLLPGYSPPASELQAEFRDLCERYGLPQASGS